MADAKKRPSCEDCGRTNFLNVIRAFCIICDPTLRCRDCHLKHTEHVGVVLVAEGPSGKPAFMRAAMKATEE